MIGIPLFSDQFRNVHIFVAKQMMIAIEREKIAEKSLDSAIDTLIRDPVYK